MEQVINLKRLVWLLVVICICVIQVPFISCAEIYGYQDKEGRWHFPAPSPGTGKRDGIGERYVNKEVYMAFYEPFIRSASRRYGVEVELIKAVIMAESGYDWTAVSKKGAIGLMQLMPGTARRTRVKNPFSPRQNIEGGVRYLKSLLNRFDQNIVLALAAYNAGPRRVEECRGVPPIVETREFVWRVLYFYAQFRSGAQIFPETARTSKEPSAELSRSALRAPN